MNQYDFQKILNKYLSGQQTREEEDFLLDHFKNNPLVETPVFEEEKTIIGKRIKKKLMANTIGEPLLVRMKPYLAAAASVLVVVGFWYFLVKKNAPETIAGLDFSPNDSVIEIKNTSGKSQHVPLEDGSIVILQKNSSISYPEHFGKQNRLVYLHGEAFFQIQKNPAKPFIVSTGTLVTKVLGTSFTVKSYEESASVEVQVKTGRVSVYEGTDNHAVNRNGVILTPNQKIVFDKKSRKIALSIIENPLLVIPVSETEHGFTFSEVPVRNVFSALEKSYGIDIVLENDSTDSCLFTGDLNGLTMFQQLDLICNAANITYERRGTALFVQGAGCGD